MSDDRRIDVVLSSSVSPNLELTYQETYDLSVSIVDFWNSVEGTKNQVELIDRLRNDKIFSEPFNLVDHLEIELPSAQKEISELKKGSKQPLFVNALEKLYEKHGNRLIPTNPATVALRHLWPSLSTNQLDGALRAHFSEQPIPFNDSYEGGAYAYAVGVVSAISSSAFPAVSPERQRWLNSARTAEEFVRQLEAQNEKIGDIGALLDDLSSRASHSEDIIRQAKDRFDNATAALDAKLKFEQLTTFWESKFRSHRARRGFYIGGIALAAVFFLFVFFSEGYSSVYDYIEAGEASHDGVGLLLSWGVFLQIGKIILLTALFLWVLRILIKLLTSEIRLMTNAEERVVMAKSFIALVREGILSDDYGPVILQSLFRPSGDGLADNNASIDPISLALLNRPPLPVKVDPTKPD